jgi:hypothetical protein
MHVLGKAWLFWLSEMTKGSGCAGEQAIGSKERRFGGGLETTFTPTI